jgi:hypothetical protein
MVSRLFGNRLVLAALIVAAVGAEYALATLTVRDSGRPAGQAAHARPAGPARGVAAAGQAAPARHAAPARLTVSSVIRACPAPGSTGATAAEIALASASRGSGRAVVTRLVPGGSSGPGPVVHVFTKPGAALQASIPAAPVLAQKTARQASRPGSAKIATTVARGGVALAATGSMARGLEADQIGPGGLASARCEAPGTSFWFAGPGQRSAASIQLYLMNTDSQPADAEADILSDAGPMVSSTDNGVAVPPHSIVVQSLGPVVRTSRVLALHVTTSIGRVVAAVRESASPALPGAWLPAAAQPGRRLTIPALPGTPGRRELFIAIPGSGSVRVTLTAVTAKGTYHPTGGSGLELPGGSAAAITLPSLGGVPAALQLAASAPVTATIMVPGGPAGAPGAFAAASSPVVQQAVQPDVAAGSGQLVLSAPGGAVRVSVVLLTKQAAFPAKIVTIPAKQTVVVPVRTPRGLRRDRLAAVVRPLPGSGPVYGGFVVTSGGVVRSLMTLVSAPSWVQLPAVRGTLAAVLP